MVAKPLAGGADGAVNRPVDVIEPELAFQVTVGASLPTIADSCTLVPASMLAGAPAIATVGASSLTLIVVVAMAGCLGNWLFGSRAANVKLSTPW